MDVLADDFFIAAEVVGSYELTTEEWRERTFLERQVERAFYTSGKALKELRDRRLYRSTHSTFEEYCRDRFGFTHRHVNYLCDLKKILTKFVRRNWTDRKLKYL